MSIKALKVAKAALKTPGVFAGGVAFGTLGLKLLASKDAKKGYSVVLSAAFATFNALIDIFNFSLYTLYLFYYITL